MKVYVTKGSAYTIKDGERVAVDHIYVGRGKCEQIDFCSNSIKYIDDTGTAKEISLEEIYNLVNP